jgi:hypothetical protein
MKGPSLLLVLIIMALGSSYGQITWKPYCTLSPNDGTFFVIDTVGVVPGGGVPVVNITNIVGSNKAST